MEKKCIKCGEIKPLSEFYAHKQMGDGHLNKCIQCVKEAAKRHRELNIEKIKEYDRNRPNAKERNELNKKRKKDLKELDPELSREKELSRIKRYREKHKENYKTYLIVEKAIKDGVLKNPGRCEKCGAAGYTEAHHENYAKPLEVCWLCDKCHKERHKEKRREERL